MPRMIALGAYLVASVVAAAPAPAHAEALASTYDEAACDPSDSGECAEAADATPSLPAPPAVLDCNDPRLDAYIAGMIGSCDMPAPTPPNTAAPTVHPAAPTGTNRICDGLCADHDSPPMRPAPRGSDDHPPLAASAVVFLAPPLASALETEELIPPRSAFPSRLERPPRA